MSITLKELAEKLDGKYWEKHSLKRVYLNRGYNTKKMKTTTYIEQDGLSGFKVYCYVDCPNQHFNWIKSQQQDIITEVNQQILQHTSKNVYVLQKNGKDVDEFGNVLEDNYLCINDFAYSEKEAEEIKEQNELDGFITLTRKEFNEKYKIC